MRTMLRRSTCYASLRSAFRQQHQHRLASSLPPAGRDFSFSGCGFLLPYHLGVAQQLHNDGFIQPATSRFAGASGGAIAALALAAGVDVAQIQGEAKRMAALCRAEGTMWKLEARLRDVFHATFAGADVAALGQRLTVATQRLWPARLLVHSDAFRSSDDLCDAVIASCFIPFYLAPRGTALFRGEHHVDGGLLTLVPELPGYVRVCAFPAAVLRRPDYEISPSLDPKFPYSVWQLARFALAPPAPAVLDELFELGMTSARLWGEQQAVAVDQA